MYPFKPRVYVSPLYLILAGAIAVSIAVGMPSFARQENSNGLQLQALEQSLDFRWRTIAALGLSAGLLALTWNWYDFRPSSEHARRRLKDLEVKTKNMLQGSNTFNDLKNRSALLEQKINEFSSRINTHEEASRRSLKALEASVANLDIQLQHVKQQIRVADNLNSSFSVVPDEIFNPMPQNPSPPASSADEITSAYNSAVLSNDRNRIRSIMKAELNITQESEDALTRGTSVVRTQLQVVSGGGSYLLAESNGKYWIYPTTQTLNNLALAQPLKEIFDYEEKASTSAAELKKPAEVHEIQDGVWEVICKGIVLVPA